MLHLESNSGMAHTPLSLHINLGCANFPAILRIMSHICFAMILTVLPQFRLNYSSQTTLYGSVSTPRGLDRTTQHIGNSASQNHGLRSAADSPRNAHFSFHPCSPQRSNLDKAFLQWNQAVDSSAELFIQGAWASYRLRLQDSRHTPR